MKLLTIHRSMQPQGDIDRLYMKRVAGGRGLQSFEDTVELESKFGFLFGDLRRRTAERGLARTNFGIQWRPSG